MSDLHDWKREVKIDWRGVKKYARRGGLQLFILKFVAVGGISWAERIVRVVEISNTYTILVWKPSRKRTLRRTGRRGDECSKVSDFQL
jgi:hypothetical protein